MKYINIILAAMLLLCLVSMPYGYYMFVRWAAMTVFAITAFNYYAENKKELAITFGALALLFQPFFKIALGRTIWNIVDVVVAILLIVLYVKSSNSAQKKTSRKNIKSSKITFTTLILLVLSACTANGNTPKHSNNHQTTLTSYKTNVQSTPNEKRTADSIYTCDYVCDSLTTVGMVEWAINMRKKDELKIENLTTEILKLVDGKTLTAIQSEIKAWNKLCKSLDETTAQILKMKWWFGGSLGSVYKADVPMEIRFIRRACLEDDYNLLNKNNEKNDTQSSNTAANTNLTGISHSIDSAIAFVSPNNIDTSYFEYKYYSNLEEYEQSFIQCKQYAAQLKGRLKEWLDTRKTVMSTLSKNKKAEYNNHTNKALNTIAKTINGCIAK